MRQAGAGGRVGAVEPDRRAGTAGLLGHFPPLIIGQEAMTQPALAALVGWLLRNARRARRTWHGAGRDGAGDGAHPPQAAPSPSPIFCIAGSVLRPVELVDQMLARLRTSNRLADQAGAPRFVVEHGRRIDDGINATSAAIRLLASPPCIALKPRPTKCSKSSSSRTTRGSSPLLAKPRKIAGAGGRGAEPVDRRNRSRVVDPGRQRANRSRPIRRSGTACPGWACACRPA